MCILQKLSQSNKAAIIERSLNTTEKIVRFINSSKIRFHGIRLKSTKMFRSPLNPSKNCLKIWWQAKFQLLNGRESIYIFSLDFLRIATNRQSLLCAHGVNIERNETKKILCYCQRSNKERRYTRMQIKFGSSRSTRSSRCRHKIMDIQSKEASTTTSTSTNSARGGANINVHRLFLICSPATRYLPAPAQRAQAGRRRRVFLMN